MLPWEDSRFMAFDFETHGDLREYALQPWRIPQGSARATSLVWAWRQTDVQYRGGLWPTKEQMRQMLLQAITEKRTIVGWNIQFDVMILLAYGLEDLVFQVKWLDGMLLWRHWFIEPEYDADKHKRKSYRLKEAVRELMPSMAGYEDEIDFTDLTPEMLAKLHEYNARDVLFTLRLTKHFYTKLLNDDPRRLRTALIEADCIPHVALANYEGMIVDTPTCRELAQKLVDDANRALAALAPHGVTEKIVRSPTQLGNLLFDQWQLPVLKENTGKKTGKISRATDKEVLHELAFVDPRAKTLREYREALNNKTKFADAPLKSAEYNGDGRSRPQANIFGTYSGRFTYASKQGRNKDERQTGFALHQEKRDKIFREIIIPPEGYTIMEVDAAGQEFRWMAVASGDETMLSLCLPGEDPHSYMGAQITNQNYKTLMALVKAANEQADSDRKLGKVANLSLQYRTSAPKLRTVARVQYNLPMELPQAQLIHRTYQVAYPGVPIYWQKQISRTKRLGYVETFSGRRVRVEGNWTGRSGWSMGSTAINYRIQGTGAEQKYLAISVMSPFLRQIGARFAWDLHDGIYMYVPDAQVSRAADVIPKVLNNLPYQKAWGFTPPIPMPWDVKIGPSWGQLKELKA